MSSIDTQITALLVQVQDYLTALVNLARSQPASASESLDAVRFDGKTLAEHLATVTDLLSPHLAASNPHQTTPALLGTYTTAQVADLLAGSFPAGSLPDLSVWGSFRGDFVQPSGVGTTKVLSIPEQDLVILGQYHRLPAVTLDLAALLPLSRTDSVYLYVQVINGVAGYTVTKSVSPLSEDLGVMYVGHFGTGDLGITSVDCQPVGRVGRTRVSEKGVGRAMPATAGQANTLQSLDPSWNTVITV